MIRIVKYGGLFLGAVVMSVMIGIETIRNIEVQKLRNSDPVVLSSEEAREVFIETANDDGKKVSIYDITEGEVYIRHVSGMVYVNEEKIDNVLNIKLKAGDYIKIVDEDINLY